MLTVEVISFWYFSSFTIDNILFINELPKKIITKR